MIRAHFGLDRQPFALDALVLQPHQAEVLETLRVHCQQGGLCLVVGEPGTGKSVIKQALVQHDPKRLITPVVNRSLHTYSSVLRVLCQAFQIDLEGRDYLCEKRLIEEANRINHSGKMLAPIVDDAHLLDVRDLRRLRLLFEDFPKNHKFRGIRAPRMSRSPLEEVMRCALNTSPSEKVPQVRFRRFGHGIPHREGTGRCEQTAHELRRL